MPQVYIYIESNIFSLSNAIFSFLSLGHNFYLQFQFIVCLEGNYSEKTLHLIYTWLISQTIDNQYLHFSVTGNAFSNIFNVWICRLFIVQLTETVELDFTFFIFFFLFNCIDLKTVQYFLIEALDSNI